VAEVLSLRVSQLAQRPVEDLPDHVFDMSDFAAPEFRDQLKTPKQLLPLSLRTTVDVSIKA
jgi:hypothetical protein